MRWMKRHVTDDGQGQRLASEGQDDPREGKMEKLT